MLKHPLIWIILTLTITSYSQPQVSIAAEPIGSNADTSSTGIPQVKRLEISLSRRQVTLYQENTPIKHYPIAIGRPGWETPTGQFQVLQMVQNPTWINPLTGESIPGGDPKNPLGRYWIGFWTNGNGSVGLHGTPNPNSIGKAVSHGCVRMYNKDVEELFSQVSLGTPVTVVL